MYIEAKTYALKNGESVIVRTPRIKDALALIELRQITAGETHFLSNYPEEINTSITDEENFLERLIASPYEAQLVIEKNGEIIGNCGLTFHRQIKIKHRAVIGIAIKNQYWHLGLGTMLFEIMINQAKQHGGITQLELQFFEGNERGLGLYQKMGFETVAKLPHAARLKDGTYLAEYTMVKYL